MNSVIHKKPSALFLVWGGKKEIKEKFGSSHVFYPLL